MSRFHAYTRFANPGLHLWREGTSTKLFLRPVSPTAGPGWVEFDYDLEPGILNDVRFMLFDFNEAGHPGTWENNDHQREVPRGPAGELAEEVWFAQDAQRVLTLGAAAECSAGGQGSLDLADAVPSESDFPVGSGDPSRAARVSIG